MNKQVLVAYASKHGATAEIAEKIGEGRVSDPPLLRQAGLSADVLPAGRVGDLSAYQAVVLGSAVYIGQWRKEAARFLQANETALAAKPVRASDGQRNLTPATHLIKYYSCQRIYSGSRRTALPLFPPDSHVRRQRPAGTERSEGSGVGQMTAESGCFWSGLGSPDRAG